MAENVFEAVTEFRAAQDQSVTDVKTVVQTNITGAPAADGDATNETLADAVAGQTNTLVATAAAVAALQQAADSGGNSGNSVLDTFEYVNATSLDTGQWSTSYLVGSTSNARLCVADGHNAGVTPITGSADIMARFIGTDRKTQTDYQRVTEVVATASETPGFGDGRVNWRLVYARVSDDELSWVRAAVSCLGQVTIQYRTSGGAIGTLGTALGPFSVPNPSPADRISIDAGVGATPRAFRVLINGITVHSATDGSTLTNLGSSYRGSGLGKIVDNSLTPGKTTQWGVIDNAPATVLGTVMQAYRSSTSGVSINSGTVPNGFFDTLELCSTDISWNATTGEATVSKTGAYAVTVVLRDVSSISGTQFVEGAVYVNGSVKRRTVGTMSGSGVTTFGPLSAAFSGTVYLTAGDVVRAGLLHNAGAQSCVGDSGGTLSFFHLAKVS